MVTEFQSESCHTIHYTHDEILDKSSCINLEQKYLFSGSANHKMRSFYLKCGQGGCQRFLMPFIGSPEMKQCEAQQTQSLHCYVINVFVHREDVGWKQSSAPLILRTRGTPLSSVTKQKILVRFQVLSQMYSIGVIPKLCFNHSECQLSLCPSLM